MDARHSALVRPGIARTAPAESCPLTAGQQRLWLFQQLHPESSAYHIVAKLPLQKAVTVAQMEQVLRILSDRHSALRTVVGQIENTPVQMVRDLADATVVETRFSSFAAARSCCESFARQAFDLERGPLFRMMLVHVEETKQDVLVWVLHHMICDGLSLDILSREAIQILRAMRRGDAPALAPVELQYVDYAAWRNGFSDDLSVSEKYWVNELRGQLPRLALPYDALTGAEDSLEGAAFSCVLEQSLARQIRLFSVAQNATPFSVLLAAFCSFLRHVTDQTDLIVGVPVSGRAQRGTRGIVGLFANTVMLRLAADDELTFGELVRIVREKVLRALRHQEFPFGRLLGCLNVRSDRGQFPLSPMFFNMLGIGEMAKRALSSHAQHGPVERDLFLDLDIYATRRGDELAMTCHYKKLSFRPETIEYLFREFESSLKKLIDSPTLKIRDLSCLQWHSTEVIIPARIAARRDNQQSLNQSETIHERVSEVATRYPGNVAIETQDGTITYAELDRRVKRLSRWLTAALPSQANRIALLLGHGAPMIEASLAALRAGACYVPLDPLHPVSRLALMLKDSGSICILTDGAMRSLAEQLSGGRLPIFEIDGAPELTGQELGATSVTPFSNAYILYTSGSTGSPKGVVQTHRNVLFFVRGYAKSLGLAPDDKVSLLASHGFDASVVDIFGALTSGATLVPIDPRSLNRTALRKYINERKITVYHSTPTLYRYLLQGAPGDEVYRLEYVRAVVLGGEAISTGDVALYKRHTTKDSVLVNGYGLTECTFALHEFFDQGSDTSVRRIPAGFPIAGVEIDVVNDRGGRAKVFGEGEIVIRCPHIAPGYWNLPDETAKAFGVDANGRRYFRTGDYGRIEANGRISFLGRRDRQVKVRGIRVEVAEIEATLRQWSHVRDCAVTVKEQPDGAQQLVCFVIWQNGAPEDYAALRKFARRHLPAHMMPSIWTTALEFPKTASGKTDYRSLPVPSCVEERSPSYVPPGSDIEARLSEMFAHVLGLNQISVAANFFDLGGHSLMAMQLATDIEKEFDVNMPIKEFFRLPTITALAKKLAAERSAIALSGSKDDSGPSRETIVF